VIDFFDSSALLKRYVEEPGSAKVDALLAADAERAVSAITHTEVACALVRRVRDATRMLDQLAEDLQAPLHVAINDEIVAISVALGVKHRLRGCDALQLAAAVTLKKASGRPVRFICADEDLTMAARAEGLAVLDPGRAT
jgi:uncharacterized protein